MIFRKIAAKEDIEHMINRAVSLAKIPAKKVSIDDFNEEGFAVFTVSGNFTQFYDLRLNQYKMTDDQIANIESDQLFDQIIKYLKAKKENVVTRVEVLDYELTDKFFFKFKLSWR